MQLSKKCNTVILIFLVLIFTVVNNYDSNVFAANTFPSEMKFNFSGGGGIKNWDYPGWYVESDIAYSLYGDGDISFNSTDVWGVININHSIWRVSGYTLRTYTGAYIDVFKNGVNIGHSETFLDNTIVGAYEPQYYGYNGSKSVSFSLHLSQSITPTDNITLVVNPSIKTEKCHGGRVDTYGGITVNFSDCFRQAPILSIISPVNNYRFSKALYLTGLLRDFNVNDSDTIKYSLDNGVELSNASFASDGNSKTIYCSINISSLVDGTHTISVWAADSTGVPSNKTTITFVKDTVPPTISMDNTRVKGGNTVKVSTDKVGVIFIAKSGDYTYNELEQEVINGKATKTTYSSLGIIDVPTPIKTGYYKAYAADTIRNLSKSQNTILVDNTSPQADLSYVKDGKAYIYFNKVLDNTKLPTTDDIFIKKGAFTNSLVTLVADEESLAIKELYEDEENDPAHTRYYQIEHANPNYFDNPNGTFSQSGQIISTPIESFSNIGLYKMTYWVKDNPKADNSFSNYRLDSKKVAQNFVVHRRPIARFNTHISSKVSSTVNLNFEDSSYDLDHTSRADKGIVARRWQYKLQSSDTWNNGKPSSLIFNSEKYNIKLEVQDMEGAWSQPYIDTLDTANLPPVIDASPISFNGSGPLNITITAGDNGENDLVLAGSTVSPKTRYALTNSVAKPISGWTDLPSKTHTLKPITSDGTYYLHMEAYDTAGQAFYRVRGPYTIETINAGHFFVTMMLDPGWRSFYFNLNNGIDDNKDGEIDRYPRYPGTDIGTIKMPINYYNLVGYTQTYIKAGYKVKGKIDISGDPNSAEFHINYTKAGKTYTDIVPLEKASGETYTFEWIIPLETDNMSFISFDLVMRKGSSVYGNEKWIDTWDIRNTSRLVFYVKGKATDDFIFIQSQ